MKIHLATPNIGAGEQPRAFVSSLDRACHAASAMVPSFPSSQLTFQERHTPDPRRLSALYSDEERETEGNITFACLLLTGNRFLSSSHPSSPPPDRRAISLFSFIVTSHSRGGNLPSPSTSLLISSSSPKSTVVSPFLLYRPASLIVSSRSRHRGIQMTSDDEYGRLSRAIGPLR